MKLLNFLNQPKSTDVEHNNINHFQFGWNIGAGIDIWKLYIELDYELGLSK